MLELEDIKDLKEYINYVLDSNDNNMIARLFNMNPIRYICIDGKYSYLIDEDYIGLKYRKRDIVDGITCMATYVVVDVPSNPILNGNKISIGQFLDMKYESDIVLHKGFTLIHCNGAKISKKKYSKAVYILKQYHGCEEDTETITVPNWKVKKYKGDDVNEISNK